jgi:hypothetical protein
MFCPPWTKDDGEKQEDELDAGERVGYGSPRATATVVTVNEG